MRERNFQSIHTINEKNVAKELLEKITALKFNRDNDIELLLNYLKEIDVKILLKFTFHEEFFIHIKYHIINDKLAQYYHAEIKDNLGDLITLVGKAIFFDQFKKHLLTKKSEISKCYLQQIYLQERLDRLKESLKHLSVENYDIPSKPQATSEPHIITAECAKLFDELIAEINKSSVEKIKTQDFTLVNHFIELSETILEAPWQRKPQDIIKIITDSSKALDLKLYGKPPLSKTVKSLVCGIIGALIGFVVGGIVFGVMTAFTGGFGALPGALLGAAKGFAVGTAIVVGASSLGLFGGGVSGYCVAKCDEKEFTRKKQIKNDKNIKLIMSANINKKMITDANKHINHKIW